LVNEEGLITSCCKLHDGSGDRRLSPAKEVEGQVEKADEEDEEDGEKRRLDGCPKGFCAEITLEAKSNEKIGGGSRRL
jgi:hypothetical protein